MVSEYMGRILAIQLDGNRYVGIAMVKKKEGSAKQKQKIVAVIALQEYILLV